MNSNKINKKEFFINQTIWIGISFAISIAISLLISFPISIAAIVGTFLLLNLYLRKRMIAKFGRVDGGSIILGGMLSPTQSGKDCLV